MLEMDRATVEAAIEKYSARVGDLIGVSKKFVIDQRTNGIFAALTENPDPMHNDLIWAKAIGGTIVYGYLQVSMLTMVWKDIGMPISSDVAYTLNYRLNSARRRPQSRRG